MNSILLLLMFIQIALMLVGIVFLWRERRIIAPASVWWAFLINDLLWLVLIADFMARLNNFSPFPIEAIIVISFAMTSLFLFRLWMRYQAHRKKQLLDKRLWEWEERLERPRREDERLHRHNWDHMKPFTFRGYR